MFVRARAVLAHHAATVTTYLATLLSNVSGRSAWALVRVLVCVCLSWCFFSTALILYLGLRWAYLPPAHHITPIHLQFPYIDDVPQVRHRLSLSTCSYLSIDSLTRGLVHA